MSDKTELDAGESEWWSGIYGIRKVDILKGFIEKDERDNVATIAWIPIILVLVRWHYASDFLFKLWCLMRNKMFSLVKLSIG